MPYISDTVLLDVHEKNATNEKRKGRFGIVDAVKDGTPSVDYLNPSAKAALSTASADRNIKIPVLKDQTVTVGTVPGFANIPINLGESGLYYFTAYNIFSGFRVYPASFENNTMDGDFYVREVLKNVLDGMAATKEGILQTVLSSRKTQVLNYTDQSSLNGGTYTFETIPDRLDISKAAQLDTMPIHLNAIMDANKVGGPTRLVTTPNGLVASEVDALKLRAQQAEQHQWAQSAISMDRRYTSDNITLDGSSNFDGWMIRDGAIGTFNNFPWDFRNGTIAGEKKWSISPVEMPFIRSRVNIYKNTEATEATSLVGSADSNLIMTHFEEMAIWDRFYVVYRYNGNLSTVANDIVQIRGLKV